MDMCTYNDIKNSTDKCMYALTVCSEDFEYINFYRMHFCFFEDELLYFTLPIVILLLIIIFYLIADTTNRYLQSALTLLSEKLGMSENLAGLTFLALGNGAPDVISSIVGSQTESLVFSLGGLLGSGVFVTCIVTSTVVLFAGEIKVNKSQFIRDIVLYLIAIGILNIFALNMKISIYEAIGFFSIYIVYILFAVWQDIQEKKQEKLGEENSEATSSALVNSYKIIQIDISKEEIEFVNSEKSIQNNENIKENDSSDYESLAKNISQQLIKLRSSKSVISDIRSNIGKKEKLRVDISNQGNDANEAKDIEKINNKKKFNLRENLMDDHFYLEDNLDQQSINFEQYNYSRNVIKNFVNFQIKTLKYRIKRNYFNSQDSFNDLNLFKKIIFIFIDFPLTLIRDLTIPNVEIKKWNRIFFIIMPFTSTIFIILITKSWKYVLEMHIYILIITAVFLFLFSILICKFTYRGRLPSCLVLVCLLSMIMSIFWIWFLATNLVDVIKFLGVLFSVPPEFLGMTILAFGNSLPDLTLNAALAKAGFGQMGLTGATSEPLFNLLIGFGGSLIKKCIKSGKSLDFDLYNSENITDIIAMCFLCTNLFRLLIQSFIVKFRFNKSIYLAGYSIYTIFFISIFLATFVVKF